MKTKYKTIRITPAAHKRLREIYAETGETITNIASRLIEAGDKKKKSSR